MRGISGCLLIQIAVAVIEVIINRRDRMRGSLGFRFLRSFLYERLRRLRSRFLILWGMDFGIFSFIDYGS